MSERTALHLIAYAPLEEVVYLHAHNNPVTDETRTQFPDLRTLSFDTISLSAAFPNPHLMADRKILPSLEHVLLKNVVAYEGDWTPLTTFLTHRMSSGNQLGTLVVTSFTHVCRQVVKDLRAMVRESKIDRQGPLCWDLSRALVSFVPLTRPSRSSHTLVLFTRKFSICSMFLSVPCFYLFRTPLATLRPFVHSRSGWLATLE